MTSSLRQRRWRWVPAAVAVLAIAAVDLELAAFLLPLAALATALLAGSYPGERRLAGATLIPAATRAPARLPARGRPDVMPLLPRGGRLIAYALAVRPPPAVQA